MLVNENGKLLEALEERNSDNTSVLTDDPPPSYSSVADQSFPTPRPSAGFSQSFAARATNYLSLHKYNSSIRVAHVIDPDLHIPLALLPPLAPYEKEENRKNVKIQNSNGTVDVELFIIPSNFAQNLSRRDGKPITIDISSRNGAMSARIVDSLPEHIQRPFQLQLSTTNGSITLRLPRSFQGCIRTSTTNGNVRLSNAVNSLATTTDNQSFYIGPLSTYNETGQSEAMVSSTNGNIKIGFEDELRDLNCAGNGVRRRFFGF